MKGIIVEVADTEVTIPNLFDFLNELADVSERVMEGIAAETSRSLQEVTDLLVATKGLVPFLFILCHEGNKRG